MSEPEEFLNDFRWIMDVVQNVDVGLVLLDQDYKVQLWNSFMQNHSATSAEEVIGHSLFDLFPEIVCRFRISFMREAGVFPRISLSIPITTGPGS